MAFAWVKQCGAKCRGEREGQLCAQPAMENGRCRIHGGKSLKGMGHPNFKHGNVSKYLPQRLVPNFEEALEDPEIVSTRKELAVVDAMLLDMYSRMDTGECGAAWRDLTTVHQEIMYHVQRQNGPAISKNLKTMQAVIERGSNEIMFIEEIGRLMDRRTRLAESERKRMVEMKQMISNDRLMVIAAKVVDAIRRILVRYIKDEKIQQRALSDIAGEVGSIFNTTTGEASDGADEA
jgi:hypothetical protein